MSTKVSTAAMDSSHPLWPAEWKESSGERTIRLRSAAREDLTLYCSWFCPFAQRAWIALEELDIPYRWVEVNPYLVDPKEPGGYSKRSLTLPEKAELLPDFIRASPRGLVPALEESENGFKVWESTVVVEYLDDAYGPGKLLPTQPQLRALVRIYVDHCTSRVQKAYYTMLMDQNDDAQVGARDLFFQECRALACAMAPTGIKEGPTPQDVLAATQKIGGSLKVDVGTLSDISQASAARNELTPGPFFFGATFSAVDIALAPFFQRFLWVGGHYRGLVFPNDDAFQRLEQWWKATSSRPSVAKTFVCKERLISSYSDYSKNQATSDFAQIMQRSLSKLQ